jgi:hypothetical protein
MLNFIRTTPTHTGLVVTAILGPQPLSGVKPDSKLISSLRLKPSKTLPRWNYIIAADL